MIFKLFRRIDFGVNPDLEIGRFLTSKQFPYTPPLAGALEYRYGREDPATVGLLTSFVPKAKDAWEYTLDFLGKFYERILTLPPERREPQMPAASVTKLAATPLTDQAKSQLDTYIESAMALGERTATLHLALAAETEDPAFAPEPFSPHAQRGLFQSMRNLMRQNFQLLNRQLSSQPADVQALAQSVLAQESAILKRFRGIYEQRLIATRIRHHGDFHLGQVLYTGKDFLIIDFEGEPAVSISERRLKRSPLQDVASMIRSFHYAAYTALLRQNERGALPEEQNSNLIDWSRFWTRWVGALFYRAYLNTAKNASFIPPNDSDLQTMMDAFLLRKAIYELGYELNNRPDWVRIPLQGILEILGEPSGAAKDAGKRVK